MPQKIRITLRGPRPSHPFLHAKGQRALVFGWFAAADPALGQALHDLPHRKPYSLTALYTDPADPRRSSFEVSVIPDHLAAILAEGIRSGDGTARLGSTLYEVEEVATVEAASWAEICEAAPDRLTELRFRLLSPTAHRITGDRGRYQWEPDPERYFRGWWERWTEFAPWPLEPTVLDLVRENVRVRLRDGTAERVQLEPTRWLEGFVGRVSFQLTGPHLGPQERSVLLALSRFATFAATGTETMRGCGETRFAGFV